MKYPCPRHQFTIIMGLKTRICDHFTIIRLRNGFCTRKNFLDRSVCEMYNKYSHVLRYTLFSVFCLVNSLINVRCLRCAGKIFVRIFTIIIKDFIILEVPCKWFDRCPKKMFLSFERWIKDYQKLN